MERYIAEFSLWFMSTITLFVWGITGYACFQTWKETKPTIPVRIAFGCQKRVGKDTAVDYLSSKYGGVCLSFAKPIYDILHYASRKAGIPYSKDRDFLIFIGEWAKKHGVDVWADKLISTVDEKYPDVNVFVSDVRFPNEFEKLRERGFILVRIVRGFENTRESDLESCKYRWDYTIHNNGSLEDFYSKLDDIMEENM